MINIIDKKACCGCSACVQRCPKKCISLIEDKEGFLYPKVDTELCIDCGICEKVCPIINQSSPKEPLKVYAAFNPKEEIRKKSSSGGIFTMLAEQIINEGGVVFGAKFDENWDVKHDYTETIDGLALFRGSKYIQSRIEDNYLKAERFLKEGRKVLFSGTPCQIAGLNRFLRKEYNNLISIEILCHGVPSPKIWRKYLKEIIPDKISYINFRDKKFGWKQYMITFIGESNHYQKKASEDYYMKGFLSNLYLRPSCESCHAKQGQSNSDLSIGDCWGIENIRTDLYDDKGISIILINTDKGKSFFDSIKLLPENSHCINLNDIKKYNGGFYKNTIPHPKRETFFSEIEKKNSIIKIIKRITDKPFIIIIINKIKALIKRFIKKLKS